MNEEEFLTMIPIKKGTRKRFRLICMKERYSYDKMLNVFMDDYAKKDEPIILE